MTKPKSVDEYIDNHSEWAGKLIQLRNILLQLPLEETIKWGGPVYTSKGKNVIGLGAFKHFVSIWFFQGVFLKDPEDVLINAQEGTTKALRQWRFKPEASIPVALVRSYALEAIENQKLNKELRPEKVKYVQLHPLLIKAFKENKALKEAFLQFSKAKQNEFVKHIEEAKQETTKMNRLKKIIPLIINGEGLNDRYKK